MFRPEVGLHRRNPLRVGLERGVERAREALAERRLLDFRRHVVLPAAGRPLRVGHVARRLFEVRHQASPFEHLGQDVRNAFARDVGAAELRDRIVTVIAQHPRVQLVGAFGADRARGDGVRGCDLTEEFVEEQAPHRLGGARVARE
jgi:hypothetical protein